jgi:hypothetical protein
MKFTHRFLLIALIVAYMLVVRHLFGWLSGHFPITARIPHDPMSALPWIVALLCVVGLSMRSAWGWWLTLAAVAFEIVFFGRHLPNFLVLSAYGAIGLFKFAWLVLMAALLVAVRR